MLDDVLFVYKELLLVFITASTKSLLIPLSQKRLSSMEQRAKNL